MAVPLDPPSSPQSKRILRELEAERKRDSSERALGWTVIWTLFAFKMATIAIIWYAAKGSNEATAYISVTTWYWLGIPVLAASGWVTYRMRLRKARQRAEQLRQAEFMDHEKNHEPFIVTDEEVRKLMALEARLGDRDRSGEG